MSNCTGCAHAFGDEPNPHQKECEICIRNPKYPTMKMPEEALVDEIILTVPQDMYISKDRKSFEEKKLMKKITEILKSISQKEKDPKFPPLKSNQTWDWYWDWEKYSSTSTG